MTSAIAIFIQYLPTLLKLGAVVPEVMEYLQKMQATLSQSKEWDQATEDAFNKEIADLTSNPPEWWKPETK